MNLLRLTGVRTYDAIMFPSLLNLIVRCAKGKARQARNSRQPQLLSHVIELYSDKTCGKSARVAFWQSQSQMITENKWNFVKISPNKWQHRKQHQARTRANARVSNLFKFELVVDAHTYTPDLGYNFQWHCAIFFHSKMIETDARSNMTHASCWVQTLEIMMKHFVYAFLFLLQIPFR